MAKLNQVVGRKSILRSMVLMTARSAFAFCLMLWLFAQFVESVGIFSSPWGEVAFANDTRGIVIDGYGLPKRFEWFAVQGDIAPWTPDHLFENGPLYMESFDVWNNVASPWDIRISAHHTFLVLVSLLLNVMFLIPCKKLEEACRRLEIQ